MGKKVIIFDFDGTLYSGKHKFDNIRPALLSSKRSFLPNLTDKEYQEIVEKEPSWNDLRHGSDIVDFLYYLKDKYPNLSVDTNAFCQWQQDNIYDIILDYNQVVDLDFLNNLCNEYSVYVVSNSSPNHIYFYMDKLGINSKMFKTHFKCTKYT